MERQVQRAEQERDEWERKHGVGQSQLPKSFSHLHAAGSSREIPAVEARTGRSCRADGELGMPFLICSQTSRLMRRSKHLSRHLPLNAAHDPLIVVYEMHVY